MSRPALLVTAASAAHSAATRIRHVSASSARRVIRRLRPSTDDPATVLDAYISEPPSAQNAIDLFAGEWSSRLPEASGLVATPGNAGLFDDERIHWASKVFGGFAGMRVLELGPLEAGHSFMLDRGGAERVDAIEANTRAYLKSLVVKEVLGLPSVHFHLGDFMSFVAEPNDDGGEPRRYDLAVASGVLYHMLEPVELVAGLAQLTDRLFIWTHYVDDDHVPVESEDGRRIGEVQQRSHGDFTYTCATQSYGGSLRWAGFCGGPEVESRWLTRSSLFDLLTHVGYSDITIGFDDREHPNGPSMAICASRPTND